MTRPENIHRSPPHSVEAEQGVLGSMLLDKATIVEMRLLLRGEQFYIPAHATIFRALCQCEREGLPTDLVVFTQYLRGSGKLETVGGAPLITRLYTFVPTSANVTYYAAIVIEMHQRRVVIQACTTSVRKAYEDEANVEQIKLALWDELKATESRRNESQTAETIREVQNMVSVRQIGGEIALKTGIPAWDKALKGVFDIRFYVLGSRPGVGKSTLMEIMMQTQLDAGKAVLMFQGDMSLTDMVGRMACRKSGLVFEDFANGTLANDDLEKISAAAGNINTDLLRIYSPENLTVDELVSIVQREIIQFDIVVFYFDLFQRLKTGKRDRVEGLTEAASAIRALIQSTGISGIIAAELRQEDDSKHKRPHTGQFKYCDGLFSNSDTAILLWSDEDPMKLMDEQTGEMKRQKIYFTIGKNRGGAVGEEVMYFDRPHMTFHEDEGDEL